MKIIKKIGLLLGLMLTVGVLAACSNSNTTSNSSSSSSSKKVNKVSKNSKTLILYFSLSGTTKEAAQYIQKETGADIIRLRPKEAYKGYDDAAKRGDRERRKNIHPALKTKLPNLDKYDNIMIGYPTWWSRPPMLISTLFDDYNFKGKTIIPFTTSRVLQLDHRKDIFVRWHKKMEQSLLKVFAMIITKLKLDNG